MIRTFTKSNIDGNFNEETGYSNPDSLGSINASSAKKFHIKISLL
jgi:hypothetical protein